MQLTQWTSQLKQSTPSGVYMKKTFCFWKVTFLPANLQNLHLQTINHKLKYNDQLKHFARDSNNDLVKWDCTFCTLNGIENPEEENYKHIFLECASSLGALAPIAAKYNITVPDSDKEGEQLIYFCLMEERWSEIRINTFFLFYKVYINACRLRKELPN